MNLPELHKSSPEPLFDGRDYFDNEELKQEQESESEREQNEKLGQAQKHKIYPEK